MKAVSTHKRTQWLTKCQEYMAAWFIFFLLDIACKPNCAVPFASNLLPFRMACTYAFFNICSTCLVIRFLQKGVFNEDTVIHTVFSTLYIAYLNNSTDSVLALYLICTTGTRSVSLCILIWQFGNKTCWDTKKQLPHAKVIYGSQYLICWQARECYPLRNSMNLQEPFKNTDVMHCTTFRISKWKVNSSIVFQIPHTAVFVEGMRSNFCP